MKSPTTTVDSRLSNSELFLSAEGKFPSREYENFHIFRGVVGVERDFWFQFALPISFSTVAARNLREFSNGLSRDTIFIYLFCIIIYSELLRSDDKLLRYEKCRRKRRSYRGSATIEWKSYNLSNVNFYMFYICLSIRTLEISLVVTAMFFKLHLSNFLSNV